MLSWYEITEPKGFLSLNDTIGDIKATKRGAKLIEELFKSLGGAKMAGMAVSDTMRKMMDGFTLIRMLNMMGIRNAKEGVLTREKLLQLNKELNQIPKI